MGTGEVVAFFFFLHLFQEGDGMKALRRSFSGKGQKKV